MKQKLLRVAQKTKIGNRLMNEQRYRVIVAATFGFFFNLLYAIYNSILVTLNHSLWFVAMCAYCIILGTMRFSAILYERRNDHTVSFQTEFFVIYISLSQNIATKYDEIFMITIATYTFGKIAMAIIRAVNQQNNPSLLLATIRSIGYAEVAVSVLTLQRSMLVSFGSMNDANKHILNIVTGAAVCLFVLGLGITLLVKKKG